jgi:hypothetical protein
MIKIVWRPLGVVVGFLALEGVVAFVVHSSLAEGWIRLTRRSSTTSTKVLYAPAPETR